VHEWKLLNCWTEEEGDVAWGRIILCLPVSCTFTIIIRDRTLGSMNLWPDPQLLFNTGQNGDVPSVLSSLTLIFCSLFFLTELSSFLLISSWWWRYQKKRNLINGHYEMSMNVRTLPSVWLIPCLLPGCYPHWALLWNHYWFNQWFALHLCILTLAKEQLSVCKAAGTKSILDT